MQYRRDPRVQGIRILRDERRDRALGRGLLVQHDDTGAGLRQEAPIARVRQERDRLRIRALERRDVRDAQIRIALERATEADRQLTEGSGTHDDLRRAQRWSAVTACPGAAAAAASPLRASASPASAPRRQSPYSATARRSAPAP